MFLLNFPFSGLVFYFCSRLLFWNSAICAMQFVQNTQNSIIIVESKRI